MSKKNDSLKIILNNDIDYNEACIDELRIDVMEKRGKDPIYTLVTVLTKDTDFIFDWSKYDAMVIAIRGHYSSSTNYLHMISKQYTYNDIVFARSLANGFNTDSKYPSIAIAGVVGSGGNIMGLLYLVSEKTYQLHVSTSTYGFNVAWLYGVTYK